MTAHEVNNINRMRLVMNTCMEYSSKHVNQKTQQLNKRKLLGLTSPVEKCKI